MYTTKWKNEQTNKKKNLFSSNFFIDLIGLAKLFGYIFLFLVRVVGESIFMRSVKQIIRYCFNVTVKKHKT